MCSGVEQINDVNHKPERVRCLKVLPNPPVYMAKRLAVDVYHTKHRSYP